jgi:hypothetical protein
MCTHLNLKEFAFSDGQIIRMCPDCTEFDAARRDVLCGGLGFISAITDQDWGEMQDMQKVFTRLEIADWMTRGLKQSRAWRELAKEYADVAQRVS